MKSDKIVLFITIFSLLTSCSKAEYSHDRDCDDVLENIKNLPSISQEYEEYDDEFVNFFLPNSPSFDDFEVIYSTSTNDITEIGLFRFASTEDAISMENVLNNYISETQSNQRAFIASYAPNEISKLDKAEVRRFGHYTVYAIIAPDEKEDLFEQIEKELKAT